MNNWRMFHHLIDLLSEDFSVAVNGFYEKRAGKG